MLGLCVIDVPTLFCVFLENKSIADFSYFTSACACVIAPLVPGETKRKAPSGARITCGAFAPVAIHLSPKGVFTSAPPGTSFTGVNLPVAAPPRRPFVATLDTFELLPS